MLWRDMIFGWLAFWVMMARILSKGALVAGVALATYTMLTRGFSG